MILETFWDVSFFQLLCYLTNFLLCAVPIDFSVDGRILSDIQENKDTSESLFVTNTKQTIEHGPNDGIRIE